MPYYNATPFAANVQQVIAGFPAYMFGGFNDRVAPTKFQVTAVSADGTHGLLTGYIREGEIPLVGALLSTQGLSNLTNLANVALTAVTLDANGLGTLQFLDSQTVALIADAGQAIIPVSETSEALANGTSVPVSVPYTNAPSNSSARSVKAVVSFPTIPTTALVTLQSAIQNIDSEYSDLVTVASVATSTVAGGMATVTLEPGRFYRLKISTLADAGRIIGKLIA